MLERSARRTVSTHSEPIDTLWWRRITIAAVRGAMSGIARAIASRVIEHLELHL